MMISMTNWCHADDDNRYADDKGDDYLWRSHDENFDENDNAPIKAAMDNDDNKDDDDKNDNMTTTMITI